MPDTVPLSDLSLAAFCPRKLHYARQTDRTPPSTYQDALDLSQRYGDVFGPGSTDLPAEKLAVHPSTFREALRAAHTSHAAWEELVAPQGTDVSLSGKDVHGVVAKVLNDPLAPSLVSPGAPPPEGVWQPQAVKAVGAAKALAWERETPVQRAFVEYPRHGVIRSVELTTRHKAAYRRTLRSIRSMTAPPPRIDDDSKCETCRFADRCGVRTRSLRSLLTG
jgi:CRISPR-associated exonuclease Cas4